MDVPTGSVAGCGLHAGVDDALRVILVTKLTDAGLAVPGVRVVRPEHVKLPSATFLLLLSTDQAVTNEKGTVVPPQQVAC